MKDPKKNSYLSMPLKKLREEIADLKKTVNDCAGCVRMGAILLDAHHRLKFANAALAIRGELR